MNSDDDQLVAVRSHNRQSLDRITLHSNQDDRVLSPLSYRNNADPPREIQHFGSLRFGRIDNIDTDFNPFDTVELIGMAAKKRKGAQHDTSDVKTKDLV